MLVDTHLPPDFTVPPSDAKFLSEVIQGLTTERLRMKVSEWAAEKRYLPSELTAKPGMWSNPYTPYLVEPMDCLSAGHPARKIVVMKGAQIGATTGLLENFIGYTIDHDPSGFIYVSADKDLTKLGVELKIDRMLDHSGLRSKLSAPDGVKTKKSGDTATLKQFPNGFLLAVGAQNPGKLRSTSSKKAALDEVDGMPSLLGQVGKEEGSPIALIEKRTDTYHDTRKILYLSTPLKMATSMIYPLYLQGDQRRFNVPCTRCNHFQHLDWHGVSLNGDTYGMVFDWDERGKLIEESVGYKCIACEHVMRNYDKTILLPDGEWVATSESQEEGLVSFHMPAFLSPPGMYPWTGSVRKWFIAWDVLQDRVKDIDAYQAFRNLEEGLPWEDRGESPKFQAVQSRRRMIYSEGEIPNVKIIEETGAPAVLVTAAVDVHKDRLDVETVAWCHSRQTYSIDWLHFEGDVDDMSDEGPWNELEKLIEGPGYTADDGRVYRIQVTLIDVGYGQKVDPVYQFAQRYSTGVIPVMGRKMPPKGSLIREFQQSESKTGNMLYNVTASLYKDRVAAWIRKEWNAGMLQPEGMLNFPQDRGDDYFKQYEAEEKVELIDARTKQRKGWEWRQIGQRPNHAWDCRVYNSAAYDMIVLEVCQELLELPKLDYEAFSNYATPRQNSAGKWLETPFSYHPEQVVA
ncbi:MAG: terminase gpA endonuclease subunit [Planctomycetota bacterium]